MGIHQLNRFLQSKCKGAIKKTHMSALKGKTIVIDTSIYMYKHAKTESIIEGMYKMITTLLYFEIIAIFIFDGKPPREKYEILDKRREKKREAEIKYNKLKSILQTNGQTEDDIKKDIRIRKYKTEFVKLSKHDIDEVKRLIGLFGIEYYTAYGEADSMCAAMVKSKKAWGCMSEDMDMFVYGCPYILRYASFINENVIIYDYGKILDYLDLTHDCFTEICILTGTDYNKGVDNIYKIYDLYNIYKKDKMEQPFYSWLCKHMNKPTEPVDINSIKCLFNIGAELDDTIHGGESSFTTNNICINKIKEFLKKYNFIFIQCHNQATEENCLK